MAPNSSLNFQEKNSHDDPELEWILVRNQLEAVKPEGLKEKIVRKTKDNPLVPIGALLTTGALSYGLWCMRTGDTRRSQLMMRARVLAQGFTVLALIGGIGIGIMKKSSQENEK